MDDECGFSRHILHKTVQRQPLRSALNPPFHDLRKLDYQLRQESPTPDRHSVFNVRRDFYAKKVIGSEVQQTLTDRIPSTHRRSDRVFATEPSPHNKRSESVLHLRPAGDRHKTNESSVSAKSLSRSKSVRRISEIENLRGFCDYARGDISAQRTRVHEMRGKFLSRIRKCGDRLRKMIEAKAKGSVPLALLEYKRKTREQRRSTVQKPKFPIEKLEKQVVSEFKFDTFAKANQASLPMKLRYIYTLGSTSAKDVASKSEIPKLSNS